jgi:hypothetical protein
MTISFSPYNHFLTVRFSQMVEFKLFPWFDEDFSAHALLNYPMFGVNHQMRRLFPGHASDPPEEVKVFAATLDFVGPDNGVPMDVCLKVARGVDEVVRLSHEASIYRRELVKLWGIAVPRMHGFFMGHHDNMPVACLMLELCTGPCAQLRDAEEFMCVTINLRRSLVTSRKLTVVKSPRNAERAQSAHTWHHTKWATRVASLRHEGGQGAVD